MAESVHVTFRDGTHEYLAAANLDIVKAQHLVALIQMSVHVRQQACARDNEELELGVRCIAAGIYDDTGKLVAGLSLSAPADRLQDSWLGQLSQTALMISESLGYRPQAQQDHSHASHSSHSQHS